MCSNEQTLRSSGFSSSVFTWFYKHLVPPGPVATSQRSRARSSALLPSATCLLPSATCLLPSASCLLPPAACSLLSDLRPLLLLPFTFFLFPFYFPHPAARVANSATGAAMSQATVRRASGNSSLKNLRRACSCPACERIVNCCSAWRTLIFG